MRFPSKQVQDSWPDPNLTNPDVRGPALIIVESVLLSLATAAVGLRLYTRFDNAICGIDDFFVVIGWVCGLALSSCTIASVAFFGWDRHIWDLPDESRLESRRFSWLSTLFYILASTFTKISVLLLYRRLAYGTDKNQGRLFKWSTNVTLYTVIALGISIVVVLFTQCRPFDYYWHILLPGFKEGSCLDEGSFTVPSMAINLILDIIILLIPTRMIYQLQKPLRKKIQLYAIFSVGGIAVVAAAVRLYYGIVVYVETFDVTWYGYMLMLFSTAEVHLGIICACCPACRPLFSKRKPDQISHHRANKNNDSRIVDLAKEKPDKRKSLKTMSSIDRYEGLGIQKRSTVVVEFRSNNDVPNHQTTSGSGHVSSYTGGW